MKIQTHIGCVLDVLDAAVGQGDAVLAHDVARGVAAPVLAEVGVVVVVVDTVPGDITTLASVDCLSEMQRHHIYSLEAEGVRLLVVVLVVAAAAVHHGGGVDDGGGDDGGGGDVA